MIASSMTTLDVAEHKVQHLEWKRKQGTARWPGPSLPALLDAYRELEAERREQIDDLKQQRATLEDQVEDLRATLAAIEEDRHA